MSRLEQFWMPHLEPGMHLAAGLGPQQARHLAGIPAKHLGRSIKDADLQRGAEVCNRREQLVERGGLRLGQQRSQAVRAAEQVE